MSKVPNLGDPNRVPNLEAGLNQIPGSKYLMNLGKGVCWAAQHGHDRMAVKWV